VGWLGGKLCALGAALAFLFALPSFFYYARRPGWSILLSLLAVFAAITLFAMRFPRTFRG
jgi:hypothetical protein